VIIITTKKGRKGSAPKVAYSGNVSVSKVKKTLDVLDSQQYQDFVKNLVMNSQGMTETEYLASSQYNNLGYVDASGNHVFANTDWQDEIYRTSVSTDHNVSITGGLKNMPYRVSFGMTDQNGVLKKSSYQRYTASFNVSPSLLDDHLTFNINGKYMFSHSDYSNTGAIGQAVSMDPTKPVYLNTPYYNQNWNGYYQWSSAVNRNDPNWVVGPNTLATGNPLSSIYERTDKGKQHSYIGNIEVDYKIHGFEDLHLHANAGADFEFGRNEKSSSPYVFEDGTYYYGHEGWNTMRTSNVSLTTYAQYLKDFNDDHHFDIMAGYEYQRLHKNTDYWYQQNYQPTNTVNTGVYKSSDNEQTRYKTENYLVSFFGRMNYSLLSRYLLTFTLRYDGSSRFHKDQRWGVFPAAALAWKINEEPFLRNVNWLSDFKLRLGWGKTGQQEVNQDYGYLAYYTPNTTGALYPIFGNGTTYRPEAYNTELTWEKTTTWNGGLDFGILNQRFTASVDVYYRKTTDLINEITLPVGTQFSNRMYSNIGELHNFGIEGAIGGNIIQTNDWTWNVNYNVTWNRNKIDKLTNAEGEDYRIPYGGLPVGDSSTDGIKAYHVGQPVSAYFVYQQVYDTNGQPIRGAYVDRNKDGIINEADRYYYKKSDADVTMGFATRLAYKSWDLGITLRASLNNYVYNAVEASNANLSYSSVYSGNAWHNVVDMDMQKGWTANGAKDVLSDYFVQNASFLKCDNITLGFSFSELFSNSSFKGLSGRIYATAQNVFTITKYKGLDPEINGGYDGNIYPRPFTGIVGLNLEF
jgi:iron complex outermembrane receptor protein